MKKLRYGENPHQKAVVYSSDSLGKGIINGTQVHGKEMSFNNIIDGNTAWQIVNEFSETSCAIIKHANPCGLALDESQANAFKKAFDGDQVSAYGGIVAFNKILEEVCLLDQIYIRDSKLKIKDLLNQLIAKLGENIHISRFTRFQVGETSQDGE